MTELTRAIIVESLFGDVAPEELRAVGQAVTVVSDRVNRSLWSPLGWLPRLPTSEREHYGHALRTLDRFMSCRIDEARRRGSGPDLVSQLLTARDAETGEG